MGGRKNAGESKGVLTVLVDAQPTALPVPIGRIVSSDESDAEAKDRSEPTRSIEMLLPPAASIKSKPRPHDSPSEVTLKENWFSSGVGMSLIEKGTCRR